MGNPAAASSLVKQIIAFQRLEDNPITDTDSYKSSHWTQYPRPVSNMYSYFESRGGRYATTTFFGLQYYLLHYLLNPITKAHVAEADAFFTTHGEPFNRDGWDYLVEKYNGRFPVIIRAVPEGTVVPTSNILFDIQLTVDDEQIEWVVSWLETKLSRVWYPTTVASLGTYCRKNILEALIESSDDPMAEINFKLHDFGSRGVSSMESARIGGAAHLVNFMGSDTVEGIRCANHYYGVKGGMAAFSIQATEHSTMWGRENEADAYRSYVQTALKPGSIAACVSDSYDVFNAVENLWCDALLEDVKASGGTLVIRPDSGEPIPVLLRILDIMDRKLGMKTNLKGYKVLPKYFRLIQGDGINDESLKDILHALLVRKYSASNIAFGMGGGLLQHVNRDTQQFAFKCSAALKDGIWIDVSKDPKTDPKKRSKKGRLSLIHEGGEYKTVRGPVPYDLLVPVYQNGAVLKTYTLDEVRANAAKGLV